MRYTTGYHAEIVREVIKKRGYKTIGFVLPETMPHKLVNGIVDGFEGLKVIDITEQIDRLIAIKSPEELDLLRRSAEMQDDVFEKVVKEIKPGMRDIDVTAMAYGYGWTQGSSQGIYLGGSAPVGKPSLLMGRHFQDRTLQKGDHMTFLVEVNGPGGYFTEVGRTIVLGKASQELKDNFAATVEAQDYSASLLKPDAPCRDIAKAHDDFMKASGLPPETRLYSHGQGYDMVERPLIRIDEPMAIEPGMCLAVHPGFETAESVRDGLRQLHRVRQQHGPHPQDRAEDFRGLARPDPFAEHAAVLVEVLPEPDRVGIRPRAHVGHQVAVAHPFPFADLGRIGLDRAVMPAAEHVHDLVLDQAARHRRVVAQRRTADRSGRRSPSPARGAGVRRRRRFRPAADGCSRRWSTIRRSDTWPGCAAAAGIGRRSCAPAPRWRGA